MMLLYATHPSKKHAVATTHMLLEKRLIACANIFPVESQYWWKGKIQKAKEWATLIKTRKDLKSAVIKEIETIHPYDVPCIITLPASSNPAFKKWVTHVTLKEGASSITPT